jgi:GT2 family glycosyltransferase
MITIIYSTHKDEEYNQKFKTRLLESVQLKDVQILEYVNKNQYSLAEVYNKGISESIYDIVVCIHNDVKLETGWGKKILSDFKSNPDYGIIGKAGSCYFPESGVYWEKMQQTMVGQVYHFPEGHKKWLNKYSVKTDFLIPVVTVDGLFIAFDKTKIKHKFDESIGKFHFYDHPFCLSNYLDGVKIGVTSSFEITHQSVGMPNEEFYKSKEVFLEKYGKHLPLDLKPNNVLVSQIKKETFKNLGKVAIIIPTKGNVTLLSKCLNSFEKYCDKELFHIFIADTGSSQIEKEEIRKILDENKTLIEYDYYNFGKINNDVVKNYVKDNFDFLLFCNNDIEILNDVITGMLQVFKTKSNVGTVGARLHFEDNTIQHDGMLSYIDKNSNFIITHNNFKSYYNYSKDLKPVIGNTAALMMIRKNTFEKCGMFNEDYVSCFEDVELNFNCNIIGLTNYYAGNCVAYHFESQTRKQDSEYNEKMVTDYKKLISFVTLNFEKLKNKLVI